jgi:hypothetical protein
VEPTIKVRLEKEWDRTDTVRAARGYRLLLVTAGCKVSIRGHQERSADLFGHTRDTRMLGISYN